MGSEGLELEEWDADFLHQVLNAEEVALSSTTQPHHHHNPPFLPPPPPPPSRDLTFSPPRELSQRTTILDRPDHSLKDDEITRLKEELARVSNQLTHLDQECAELRKERDRKDEQLQTVYSRSTINDATLAGRDSKLSDPQTCSKYQDANFTRGRDGTISKVACKAAGVQTDNDEPDSSNVKSYNNSSHVSSKLLSVWKPSDLQVARNIVSKVLVSCEADIRVLLNPNLQHKENDSALVQPMMATGDPLHSPSAKAEAEAEAEEAAKILDFHSTFTRFSEGRVKVGDLVESLIPLCRLKNVYVLFHLRVLATAVLTSSSLCRDDVVIETSSSDNVVDELKSSLPGRTVDANGKGIIDQSCNLHRDPFGAESSRPKYNFDHSSLVSFDQINWISLLQLMCQITSLYRNEYVRQEAVSIMNIIVMRSNPYTDREKFVSEKLFQSISELLRKEAGLGVQTRAVHLLYLLLNCPKIMSWFCTTCREEVEKEGNVSDIDDNNVSASHGCHMIFKGLADCISCSGLGSQELRLRRNAIILLAFLASSGTCGFEIMFGNSSAKKFHLLAVILHGLSSDIDLEAKDLVHSPETFKERILLMRETLILLNGLVSHPQYCGPVLRALTSSRDMLCSTVGIANRLAIKANCKWKDDSITTQIREVEVLELARFFKKKICTFLGNSIP